MRATPHAKHPCSGLLVATAFALAIVPPVRAHDFCVTTANQLQNALTAASAGGMYNGEDNLVQVVQGVYLTPADGFHYYSTAAHRISILGSYTDASCSSMAYKPLLAKLDGHGATGVLSISNGNGPIYVAALTMQNGNSGIGAGLQVNYLAVANNAVSISDVIIRNNHSNADAGGLYAIAASGRMTVSDTLIANNSADQLYGAGYLLGYGDFSYVISNTIARNTSGAASDAVGGLYVGGTATWVVYKNIVWNNTGDGLYLGNSAIIMVDNDYGNIGGMTPGGNSGHISVNPSFVDADNGNFHLAGDSPLLGYSRVIDDSDFDLDGNHPPTGGAMDLGAYYETIFMDGFEGD